MKQKILTLILLLGAFAARADNIVSVTSASGHPQDEVTLNVSFANTDAAVAFQAEIPLGSQLTYVAGSVALNPERITDHQVSAAVVGGSLRIYAFSLSLTPFVGNEGNLLSFTLRLKNEPGDYALELNETKLSDALGNALPVTTNDGMVTILSPKLQINTTSLDYGHVPIRSEYTQEASLTNVGNEPLTITAITFSDAVFSCPSFTEITLQPGNSANFTFKFAPMLKGAVTATVTIVSNSISGNGTINLLADPFAVNEIHIDYVTGYCDSIVEVPIRMNNMEEILGFQVEMNLSQALEYVDFTLSNRKTDHISVGVFNEGLLRLIAYSASGSAFIGEDGVIGTLRLRLHGMYGDYYLNPFKSVLADANGEDALSAQYQGRVTIRSPRINGNNSLSFGSSPVTETVTREYEVYNYGNAQMRIDQVVFDQSNFSIAETFPIVVEEWVSTTLHVSYNREQKGDFTALMKIYSNDPQNGLKNVTLSGSRFEPNSIELTADPFSLEDGDVAVSLAMDNYSSIVALQANFCYPYQDYSVQASDFQLTERFVNHFLYTTPLNDSTFRIIVLSMQNSAVEGHEGAVLNVTLHPVGTPSEEAYTVSVTDVVLSDAESENVFTGNDVSVTFALTVTQAASLASGWSWWSTYIEQDGIDGLGMLENSLGDAGIRILGRNGIIDQFEYQGTSYWYGSLNEITNEQMYKIRTNEACSAVIVGEEALPANHPVTINGGWNWIGFPCSHTTSVDAALSGFTPEANDVIKGRNGTATYISYGSYNLWYGTLTNFEPGQGYMYKSNSGTAKTLTFQTGRGEEDFVHVTQENGHFTPNADGYADNMLVTAVIEMGEQELRSEDYEIGAFVVDECRGSAKLMYVEPFDRYVAFLLVFGETEESIRFALTDGEEVVWSGDMMTFASDGMEGTVTEPAPLHFGTLGINEGMLDFVNVFPNPSNGIFSIEGKGIRKVEVIDVFGQTVLSKEIEDNQIQIDLSSKASGVYLLRVVTNNGITTKQIIME